MPERSTEANKRRKKRFRNASRKRIVSKPKNNLSFLKANYHVTAAMAELIDVTRQKLDSGILSLATSIRSAITSGDVSALPVRINSCEDVIHIDGQQLQEYLEDEFSRIGPDGAVLITRSNKRANQFNEEIRARVFYYEETLSGGDYIMCVRNNYHWLSEESNAGFIANGDVLEVTRLGKQFERYGFQYQEASVRLIDYPMEPELEVVLWLDALRVDASSMPKEANDQVYKRVMQDYSHLKTKKERVEAVKKDPVYNALQIKFAYAVTCHKSQGGQWPAVFVDQGYVTEEMLDVEYLRWLYTAVTRATQRLYLLNFSDKIIQEAD